MVPCWRRLLTVGGLIVAGGGAWAMAPAAAGLPRFGRAPRGRVCAARLRVQSTAGDGSEAEARRAAYLREREAREQQLLPRRVDMEAFFDEDVCPDYIERWGGMHRQVAMEGPSRKALEMAVDSEWAVDAWTETPTETEEGTPTPSS